MGNAQCAIGMILIDTVSLMVAMPLRAPHNHRQLCIVHCSCPPVYYVYAEHISAFDIHWGRRR